jgi:hypothetical protein
MALKPQSIRKGMQIWVDKKPIEKQDLLKLSESWTEQQENFFKKMLKQGGEFKIQGKQFKTTPPNQILTSKGEKDAGVIQIPGLDSRF